MGESLLVALPAEAFCLRCVIQFDHPLIKTQMMRWSADESFLQVAPARTFGFLRERAALQSRGLALGASPQNTVILTDEGLFEGTSLRFEDEFVRHKALDVLGDLVLLGCRLQAEVVAIRPSHGINAELVRRLHVLYT